MKYIYTLFDKKTGLQSEYKEDYDWDNESTMLFQWLENNYDCDCNRSIFLYGYDEKTNYPCCSGEADRQIDLLKITDQETGKVVYLKKGSQ